ncbi:MAG: hypothetical protein H6538_00765 [Bacteroidales bacterium]|nr:hypothetical protein [Bacteroidales bacterium]MCB9012573.1 hypothetical protein [Bacteroidales bacterium]
MDSLGSTQKTVYYIGNYEKEIVAGNANPKEIHYIYAGDGLAAIYTKQDTSQNMYYVYKDHLGSFDKITNSAGAVVDSCSFDAWGRRRNPTDWTYSNIPTSMFSRGYTGHEHLDQLGLINMNGRMYDPLLGRFLSADPFVANPFVTQDYNRYSYVVNNPLKYTDPSGYMKYLDALRYLIDYPNGTTWTNDGNGEGHLNFGDSQSASEATARFRSMYGTYGSSSSGSSLRLKSKGRFFIGARGLLHDKWQFVRPILPKFEWYNSSNNFYSKPFSELDDNGQTEDVTNGRDGIHRINFGTSTDQERLEHFLKGIDYMKEQFNNTGKYIPYNIGDWFYNVTAPQGSTHTKFKGNVTINTSTFEVYVTDFPATRDNYSFDWFPSGQNDGFPRSIDGLNYTNYTLYKYPGSNYPLVSIRVPYKFSELFYNRYFK